MLVRIFCLLRALQAFIGMRVRAQAAVDTVTPEQIIEKATSAMGERDYLMSIHTMYSSMMTERDGRDVQWITTEMTSNKGFFQIIYKNRVVSGFNDLEVAWNNGNLEGITFKNHNFIEYP
jgi:hypothetical protein